MKKQMILFVIASITDLAITLWGTALVGYGAEGNHIARGILMTRGPLGLSAFKLGGVVLVLVLLMWLARDDRVWVRQIVKLWFVLGALMASVGVWSWLPVLASIY